MSDEEARKPDCTCMIDACQRCYSNWIGSNRQAAEKHRCKGEIQYLIVAESPPCHRGRDVAPYIYRVHYDIEPLKQTGLLYPIMKSLENAHLISSIPARKEDCLGQLRRNRVFVIDLCEFPINKMPRFIRRLAASQNITDLASRLEGLGIVNNIVTAIERCEDEVEAAIRGAGLQKIVRENLPFPRGRNCQQKFIDGLSEVFSKYPGSLCEDNHLAGIQERDSNNGLPHQL